MHRVLLLGVLMFSLAACGGIESDDIDSDNINDETYAIGGGRGYSGGSGAECVHPTLGYLGDTCRIEMVIVDGSLVCHVFHREYTPCATVQVVPPTGDIIQDIQNCQQQCD